uniref:Uncharacterized protein LOC114343000 n=1 Tax=Diabrotica virgifera virgifera TaxID=50390 RepID=A0A6P7GW43_DIAVI
MHIWFILVQLILIFYCCNCIKTEKDKDCIRKELKHKFCSSQYADVSQDICNLMPDHPGYFVELSQLSTLSQQSSLFPLTKSLRSHLTGPPKEGPYVDCCSTEPGCGPSDLEQKCMGNIKDGTWCDFIKSAEGIFVHKYGV